jgi:hypothetical protein
MQTDCPILDHLACKLPGEQEPRIYDVFASVAVGADASLPMQSVEIGNRDAPWHLASVALVTLTGTAPLYIRLYNSRGTSFSDVLIRAENRMGGTNAAFPVMPSMVWPVNSSLVFDLLSGAVGGSWGLLFYGFKIFDRGKAPC